MRFFEKTKGAISLFLVIILVPMLTLSGLFVDTSKVNLARAMAESAGDLTLNTALTNYDSDLKELYGLMATAQDTSDLFERLEDYYKTCITSAGVSSEDADTYVGQIMAQLGVVSESNDTADIMKMQVVDFTVEKFENANLANATILEKQIVDFMKYRAPINTGLSFVTSLKSFSTLSKQTELVEKKQAYYEAQQGVMENLKEAWKWIAEYNKTNIVQSTEYLAEIQAELENMKDGTGSGTSFLGYKQLHDWLVMDLYHVGSYIDYRCYVDGSNRSYSVTWNDSAKNNAKGSIVVLPEGTHIQNAVNHLKAAIETAQESYGRLVLKYDYPVYDLQHLVQQRRNNSEVLDVYTNKMIEVHGWYLTLEGLYNNLAEYDRRREAKSAEITNTANLIAAKQAAISGLQSGGTNTETSTQNSNAAAIAALQAEIIELNNSLTTLQNELNEMKTTDEVKKESITVGGETKQIQQWYSSMGSAYDTAMGSFDGVAKIFSEISINQKAVYDSRLSTTKTTISDIAETVNTYLKDLEDSKEYLGNAIAALTAAKTALEGDVAGKKAEWSGVANNSSISGTSLARQDQAEIEQLDTYLTADNVGKLLTRLKKIEEEVGKAIQQLKNYKYCGKFIGELDTYDKLENAIEGKYGKSTLESVPVKKDALSAQAATWWSECWQDGGLSLDWVTQSGCQPDLTKDKCSMYSYLYSHFAALELAEGESKKGKDAGSADKDSAATKAEDADDINGKNFYADIKKTAKESADASENGTDSGQAGKETKGNNITGDSLPSKKVGGDSAKAGTVSTDVDKAAGNTAASLGSLFSADFLNAVADMGTDLRDKLYVADYAMSMFTYDTIENEYKKKNDVDAIEAGTLLSLTKNDLSKNNNYAYGAEVEYIIYGGENSSNLTKAYGTIYGIRFGFNLIYAFATSEIRDSALAIATPISAATLGVIPVPLIQAAIIIALACCESAVDLVEIRDGNQIPLYKSKSTWVCSVTGLSQKAKNKGGEIVKEYGAIAVDEGLNKLNELLDMTDEELNNLMEAEVDEIVESIQFAYDQIITENANLAIQRVTMLITTAVEKTRLREAEESYEDENTRLQEMEKFYEEKKAESLAWVKQELQAWGNEQIGNDLTSVVKREAVRVIIDNSDILVNGLFAKIEESVQTSEPGKVIDEILNVPDQVEDGIAALGGEIMEYISEMRDAIFREVINTSEVIKNYKNEAVEKIKGAMEKGAEELKTALNNYVEGICGNANGGEEGISAASLCSFAYSDYLRLFTLIGLYVNEEKTVLRIGDVIQTNMAKCIKKEDEYVLDSSATYVKIVAEIQVKPIFMALPLFADVENNPNEDSRWYTIQYNGMAGY